MTAGGVPVPVAPWDDPLSYPGELPRRSFLLDGDRARDLDPTPGELLSRAVLPGTAARLGELLARLGATPLTGRRAVLAVGSNGSPAQLIRKFRGAGCSPVVVGLRARVWGLQVLPSAHLSRRGYWPFAPSAPGPTSTAPSELIVSLLDDRQLQALDATEPHYRRVRLDPGAVAVRPTGTDSFEECWIYLSRHGVVDDPRLPRWTSPAAAGPQPPSQVALLQALLEVLPELADRGIGDPAGLVAAAARRPELADEVSGLLRRRLRVRPAGLLGG